MPSHASLCCHSVRPLPLRVSCLVVGGRGEGVVAARVKDGGQPRRIVRDGKRFVPRAWRRSVREPWRHLALLQNVAERHCRVAFTTKKGLY